MTLTYLGLVYEGILGDYDGKPMHHIRVLKDDGTSRTERLNAAVVGETEAEALAWLEAQLAADAEQAALDALIGLEV